MSLSTGPKRLLVLAAVAVVPAAAWLAAARSVLASCPDRKHEVIWCPLETQSKCEGVVGETACNEKGSGMYLKQAAFGKDLYAKGYFPYQLANQVRCWEKFPCEWWGPVEGCKGNTNALQDSEDAPVYASALCDPA